MRAVLAALLLARAAAISERGQESAGSYDKGGGHYKLGSQAGGHYKLRTRQTPEELGFIDQGGDAEQYQRSPFSEEYCLDLGAKGFPLPVFEMMRENKWNPAKYFEVLNAKGYAEDALQMTGPQDAILKGDCMRENFKGKLKHIFVGDSQMMSLRNAYHRLSGCPEIWYKNRTNDVKDMIAAVKGGKRMAASHGRFHSQTDQAPESTNLPTGCRESGIASYIFWDSVVSSEIPFDKIKREMEEVGVDPKDGDTVVVWVGSNFIPASHRYSALLDTIDKLHMLGVKMVWDSPTFQDEAIMAATTSVDLGMDTYSKVPITYTSISQRKGRGHLGSGEYKTEKTFLSQGVDIPMTKRWQLTNRYRGLQCDGMHTDMRARDPLFYEVPCPVGPQEYGRDTYCSWVEPFRSLLRTGCPAATGVDDLVLQSGLYSACAAHEAPFCYTHTEHIR